MLVIKLGTATQGHEQTLKALGYTVTNHDGEYLTIDAQAYPAQEFTWTKENVQELVSNHQLLTYRTKITFEDGKVLSSILACGRMGALSALMAKAEEEKQTKKQLASFDIDDILS